MTKPVYIFAFLCAVTATVAGIVAFCHLQTAEILETNAETKVNILAQDIARNIHDLPEITRGKRPSRGSKITLERFKGVGRVFRVELYEPSGRLVYVSEDRHPREWKNLADRLDDEQAAHDILKGASIARLKLGLSEEPTTVYSASYAPVIKDGEILGVVASYAGQTEQYIDQQKSFGSVIAITMLFMALAAAVPSLLAYRRAREKRLAEARFEYLESHDPLTGLANRTKFKDNLHKAIVRASRTDSRVAVLCFDIDHFKSVNDSLGHKAGDELLKLMADRVRRTVREDDAIARLSGDEFAAIQVDDNQPASSERLAQRLLMAFRGPYAVPGEDALICTSSIGIAVFPEDSKDADTLLKNADLALNRAKREGRNGVCFFTPAVDAAQVVRRQLEADLNTAFEENGLELHYQPLVNARTGAVMAFEGLMRWKHPTKGDIPPGQFIPLAEETGLIVGLGNWAIRQACKDAKKWPDACRVAVNLSPAQFQRGDIVATVRKALMETGLKPDRLELEITEGLLMENTVKSAEALNDLKKLGVRIALDDFGTGYSSMTYLWQFPFDKLKIDQAFVRGLEETPQVLKIVRTIVRLASALKLEVTVEGIETETHAKLLSESGCKQLQGFYYGHAMPVEKTVRLRLSFAA